MKFLSNRRWGATEVAHILFCLVIFFLPLGTFSLFSSPAPTDFEKTFLYATDFLVLSYVVVRCISIFGRFTSSHTFTSKHTRLFFVFLLMILIAGALSVIFSPLPFTSHDGMGLARLALLIAFLGVSLQPLPLQWKKIVLLTFTVTGAIQAVLAILQFHTQASVGLPFFGEPRSTVETLNIGKIFVEGTRLIRPMGTFPHANVLGGFMVITIMANAALFLRSLIVSSKAYTERAILFAFLLLQVLALILTFSRSAWLSSVFILLFAIAWLVQNIKNLDVPLARLWIGGGVAALMILVWLLFPFLRSRTSFQEQAGNIAIELRADLTTHAYQTIARYPITGVGYGDFVAYLRHETPNLASWQYQPVHSWILLITAEQGIIGLASWGGAFIFGFVVLLRKLKKQGIVPLLESPYFMVAAIMTLSLFDHYLVDIQQGRLLFFTVGALFYSEALSNLHLREELPRQR